VASDQQSANPTLMVEINRDVASRLGVDPALVDSILYDAFGQRHVARIYTTLNEYYVILEVDPSYQLGPNALSRIYAKSIGGAMIPLSQFATVSPSIAWSAGVSAGNPRPSYPRLSWRPVALSGLLKSVAS
jgi:multidrug efflux pump subunit AcrB